MRARVLTFRCTNIDFIHYEQSAIQRKIDRRTASSAHRRRYLYENRNAEMPQGSLIKRSDARLSKISLYFPCAYESSQAGLEAVGQLLRLMNAFFYL